jgi:hypothetical protein
VSGLTRNEKVDKNKNNEINSNQSTSNRKENTNTLSDEHSTLKRRQANKSFQQPILNTESNKSKCTI